MKSRPDELETFKTSIDLVSYAEEQGYVIDQRRQSRTSIAMRHAGTGDRILVALNTNGHYIYASIHDPRDNGSIIDFCQNRGAGSLGHVRKLLRPWFRVALARRLGGSPPRDRRSGPPLEPVSVDLPAVRAAFEAMSPIEGQNAFLTTVRGIPAEIYGHPMFSGRIRVDRRGNIAFPHWQSDGQLTGFELKNQGFTGFAKGGVKRLFGSGIAPADSSLVICESAIDALSYAAVRGIDGRRFVSTAGSLNPDQLILIRSAIQKLPNAAGIILAVDADDGGDVIADQVTELHRAIGRSDVEILRDTPATRGQDWNDVLRGGEPDDPSPT